MVVSLKASETYTVRHQELRQGKPLESCIFDGDDLQTTIHFGYKNNNEIIGVVSVFLNDNINYEYKNQYQVRGMAVLSAYQGKGIGKKLFIEMEKYLVEKNINFIWFNARLNAINFYESLDCKIDGDIFEIEDVGPHFLMFKILK